MAMDLMESNEVQGNNREQGGRAGREPGRESRRKLNLFRLVNYIFFDDKKMQTYVGEKCINSSGIGSRNGMKVRMEIRMEGKGKKAFNFVRVGSLRTINVFYVRHRNVSNPKRADLQKFTVELCVRSTEKALHQELFKLSLFR